MPKRTRWTTWAVGGVMLLVMGQCSLSEYRAKQQMQVKAEAEVARVAALSPQQRAAEQQRAADAKQAAAREEAAFQRAVLFVKAVRAQAKNPASFQFEGLGGMSSGALCLEYRATNGFNAVVPGWAVLAPDDRVHVEGAKGAREAWNRHCANKQGEDLRRVRHAL